MLFDTPIFFVFLALVVAIYWRLGWLNQNKFLLACSYLFYGWWDWRFMLLMMFSTGVDYVLARMIAASTSHSQRKRLLFLSLCLNFTILGFFKYFNFFIDSFSGVLNTAGIHNVPRMLLAIVLPPGISFYTFQEVAYIVDVYYKRLKPANTLTEYALFISLFPHLIAGPIQRPSHLLPQVQQPRHFDTDVFFNGLMLILTGLVRKCVIADQCAPLANAAFDGKLGSGLWPLIIGSVAFAWQIYGDFSGYSDIARGSAQLLGFHFMVNFRQPYFATTLQDFWRRWHISLSTWLRDYLYIPLGGNRKGAGRTYLNLLVTMLLGGLWHGANWTFVIWGGLHGLGLAMERLVYGTDPEPKRFLTRQLSRIPTLAVVLMGWVFFRATSVSSAWHMIASSTTVTWMASYAPLLIFLGIISALILCMDLVNETTGQEYVFAQTPAFLRIAVAGCLTLLLIFGAGNDLNAFIYFQF